MAMAVTRAGRRKRAAERIFDFVVGRKGVVGWIVLDGAVGQDLSCC
jgi:hypothetical protein